MNTAFITLKKHHPWPDTKGAKAHNFTLGGGGRDLIERELTLISKNKGKDAPLFMLEIGCFLCASTRRWLTAFPNLHCVGVDPWPDSLMDQVKKYVGRPLLNKLYPDKADQADFVTDIQSQGPMVTALANMRGLEDRFIPVKGYAPEALTGIAATGFTPDLVYIDGAKQSDDLLACYSLWPDCKISGDDWHWGRTYGYPMRKIVKQFAKQHGFGIEANWATWVLHKDQQSDLIIQAGHTSDLQKLTALAGRCDRLIDFHARLGRMLVVYQGKKLVGAGSVHDQDIDMMVVDPDYQDDISPLLIQALRRTLKQSST